MRSRRLFSVLVISLLAALLTTQAAGQASVSFAQLNGTVLDTSGRAVVGASITLRSLDTNQTYSATTNTSGFYVLPSLPPGRYELSATYTGFGKFTQTGIVLTVGETATVNVTLKVATAGETIVVTTEAPVVETTRTEISQVIDTKQIADLPTASRRFTDFALLTPGVASSRTSLGTTFTEFEVTQISFGGMRSFSNEITVDGADFVNTISGVQRATPPQDSVQEFRVVNNSFGSEYGRALGGIVNIVTKSGTNDLHGTIYDYLQNTAANSRSLLQPSPLPYVVRQNQFGASLGGPIVKNRTFFFANYEGQRRGESPTYAPDLVNNLAEIDQAKAYLGLSPEGCNLPPAQCTGTPFSYLASTLKTVHNDYGFARLDHQFTTNNRFALRYVVEDARDTGELIGNTEDGGGIGTPSGGRDLFIRDQAVVGTLNSVLKPTLVNTAMFQYSRRHYNFPGATGEPDLSVVNDLEMGHNFGTYDAIYESRAEGSETVSWVRGNHSTKFGFDGNYLWSYNNYPGFTPARVLLPNLGCMYAFADYIEFQRTGALGTIDSSSCPLGPATDPTLPGPPGAEGISVLYFGVALPRTGFTNGDVPPPATGAGFGSGWPNAFPTNLYNNYAYSLNHGYWGFFAQDQWRLTPRFTLNYGLRWDFESGLGNIINADYRGFQPRVGFAYSPDSKTVIRSGFGIFFDRNNMTFFFTTGNQKTIPGYLCNPPTNDPSCAGVTPVAAPMIHQGAQNGGWQLAALPGEPAAPAELVAASIFAGQPYPAQTLSGACPPACGVGAGGIQKDGRLPYAEQASLEIDRELGHGFTLDVGYLFVAAHKLVRGNNLNVPCPIGTKKSGNPADVQGWLNPDGSLSPCEGTPTLGPLGLGPIFSALPFGSVPSLSSTCPMPYQSPFPYAPSPTGVACVGNPAGFEFAGAPFTPLSAGLLDYNNNVANSIYHGLTVTALERLGKYFSLTANYTYSHTIDNGNFTTFINLPVNQFDYSAERANSNQDARHRFVANFTATAPNHGFARNFEFSSIVTLQSGRPFTLFVGSGSLGDLAGPNTDRVGGPPVEGTCTSVSNCETQVSRNTYVGDKLADWDARISRNFHIGERMGLHFSVDAFNLLNRGNIDEVTSVYGSPVFCGASPVIPKHYNDATTLAIQSGGVSCASQQAAANPLAWLALGMIPVSIPNAPNPVFGKPRTMLNPRQLQLSVKFTF